jgi:hypothetical protein
MLIISQNTSKLRTAAMATTPSLRMNPDKGAWLLSAVEICPLADRLRHCEVSLSDKGIYPLALSRHCEARSNPVSHKMFIPLKKKKIHLLRIWITSGYRPRNDGNNSKRNTLTNIK